MQKGRHDVCEKLRAAVVVLEKTCGHPVRLGLHATTSRKPCRPLQPAVSLGVGCEAQGDLAQAERMGWGAVQEGPGTQAKVRSMVSLVSLETSME